MPHLEVRDALFLGLISGTSADGIDAALVAFPGSATSSSTRSSDSRTDGAASLRVVAARTLPYPEVLRTRVVALARREAALSLDELGTLDAAIGHAFADAALTLLREANVGPHRVAAIGSHGQTIRHRPDLEPPFTMQIGDAHVIAERTGIATVADFRRRDLAAGGQGAPLLPALHAAVFADAGMARAVVNLGGIANVTVLAPGQSVLGFDTGPANCLLDAWAERHLGVARDENGAWAACGRIDPALLARCLADPYFVLPPPKSTGREMFHLDWLSTHGIDGIAPADVQATLLALSAQSLVDALDRHAPAVREVYACGGGVHNAALMRALVAAAPERIWSSTAALGVDPDFVEAIGFAWLAREHLAGRAGNLPSVTGAHGPRVLGALHPPT